jgi:hypothetical protein
MDHLLPKLCVVTLPDIYDVRQDFFLVVNSNSLKIFSRSSGWIETKFGHGPHQKSCSLNCPLTKMATMGYYAYYLDFP